MINVLDFGAKGDGKTDNTKALQKALDEAGKIKGTVYVPDGIFLSSTLKMHPHTAIQGNPIWSFPNFPIGGGGSIIRLNNDKVSCLIDISGATGARISGLCLDGADLGNSIHGILSEEADYGKIEDTPLIEDCKIGRFSGDGIKLFRIWCFRIRHCMLGHNKGNGLSVRGWDGFLIDNWFSGNGGSGFFTEHEKRINTMTGNRIEWNKKGGIHICGGNHYNITGNYIDRSGGPAIKLSKRDNKNCAVISIVGNVIYRSGKPEWTDVNSYDSSHVRLEDTDGLVFTGNTFNVGRDDSGKGEYSPNYCIVYGNLKDSIIKDNVMYNGALKELIVDLGNNKNTIVKDNLGSLFLK